MRTYYYVYTYYITFILFAQNINIKVSLTRRRCLSSTFYFFSSLKRRNDFQKNEIKEQLPK